MSISKKERRFSIWIGIAIGVAISSMLVRYALHHKSERAKERPGNYKSLTCASDGSAFDPIPEEILQYIPHGIVVFFENNQTTQKKSWVIETAGSFRSERLFILAQEIPSISGNKSASEFLFHRSSELYLLPTKNASIKDFEKVINSDDFRIIGTNSSSGEWILQVKNFSPHALRKSIKQIEEIKTHIAEVRLIPWKPIRQ